MILKNLIKPIDKFNYQVYHCIRTITQTKRSDAMAWKFSSGVPVYLQLADKIRLCIISGEYSPGSQIPSVRQLAFDSATNPNTVQHAFTILEDSGIIETRGTLGRFVTMNTDIITNCRQEYAKRIANDFISTLGGIGLSKEEIITIIKEEHK